MHNLALALHNKGYEVSGSDDVIFDPSKSRLEAFGLLPDKEGWFPNKITGEIVIQKGIKRFLKFRKKGNFLFFKDELFSNREIG